MLGLDVQLWDHIANTMDLSMTLQANILESVQVIEEEK